MKVLVTGGSGFIGSNLVDELIEQGHDVNVLDKIHSKNKKVNFIFGNITDKDDVKKAMKDCEAVFHLAAITNIREMTDDDDYRTNFLGAMNVFSAAKDMGIKIIFSSSAAVYGNAPVPVNEDEKCVPVSSYGKNKLKAEKICGKNSFILRFFNVYGPGGKSFINTLCKKIPSYEDITVYGTGMQTRDYIYISDIVSALLLGMSSKGIYNVGSGKEISVFDLIDTVSMITKAKPHLKFTPPIEKEIKRSAADIEKIKNLGWKPEKSLSEGIMLTLESAKKN